MTDGRRTSPETRCRHALKSALDCRVVMVTAVDPSVDTVGLPFDEYIVKPVGREELVAVVDKMHRRVDCDDALRQLLALADSGA